MTNWERRRAFYVEGLGFRVDWEHRFEPGFPVFASLTRDGLSLFVTGARSSIPDIRPNRPVADRAPILVAELWDVAVGLQAQPDGDERHSLELLVTAAGRAHGRRICDRVVGHIMACAATHPHPRRHPQ